MNRPAPDLRSAIEQFAKRLEAYCAAQRRLIERIQATDTDAKKTEGEA